MDHHPDRHPHGTVPARRWRARLLPLMSSVFAVIGLVLITYPTAASWITQYNQSKVIENYAAQLHHVDPEPGEQIRRAHHYNDALNSGALLEANANLPTGNGTGADPTLDYFSLLKANESGVMGRIRIPSINVDLPIFHGTSDEVLDSGIGHLQGTSLPVGGLSTRTVLTGHRGLANAEMFTNLDKVREGDTFSLEVFGKVFVYRVYDTKVVDPDATEAIRMEPGRDLATLVTCTPLGINTHRILLTGERILPTPKKSLAEIGNKPVVPFFPWWIVWTVAGLLLIALYAWRSGYPVRHPALGASATSEPPRDDNSDTLQESSHA